MRQPQVFSATEISNWRYCVKDKDGRYVPFRPCQFNNPFDWSMIRMRLFCAWKVFIGRYDALNWEGDTK